MSPRLESFVRILLPGKRHPILGYLVALALVVLSTAARFLFEPYLRSLVFFTYFPAVMIAGWFGGFGPGILATFISALCVNYFWMGHSGQFSTTSEELIQITFFFVSGAMISAFNAALHLLLQTLERARSELKAHAASLERAVEERTDELRSRIAQLEEFSYTVSHDLRAPLRAMQGYATAVLEDHGDQLGPTGKTYLERIAASARRMDRLTEDLLAYSKLNTGKISLDTINLEKLATEVVQHYPNIQAAGAQVNIRHPLLPALGNESLMTQALANLIGNAVKFVPPGRTPIIEIWTEAVDSKVRIFVKDNGIGIQPQYQARLFGLFSRLHSQDKYEGTGVGLAIVRRAAERMNGSVGVQSDGVNGSTFWVELPSARN